MQTWTETRLWKQLTASPSPERPSVQGLLEQWMPTIERVLDAGTSPLDFTLHDAEHSFRVAEWMAKIVPEDVLGKLSVYELALLLLSAYLHDIGMTPEQARVQRHWRHLVFGSTPEEKDGLSPEEAAEFQRWLDDERGGLVPPLARDGKAEENDLRVAAELTTYYARHKHNDWSGDWICQNASGHLGTYEGWIEDLVSLCQSHHEGYAELVKEPFDPRPVGRHGEVVHLRYLACVLRVADILDVDPERTPPVLFQHRDIAPKSVVYWWKDHDFWVRPDGSALVVHARPRSAVVEKAVRDTAEWIRLELETCARLEREKPFSHGSFRFSEPLPHRWSFPESLLLQVRPRNDDYVYIDGAFRPNTTKLLELFSGTQLYKEPLAAVRELLQNAFDAVKEQIALERLEGDPADERRTDAITALQSVELRFEEREGRFWLLCTDSGIGMTRPIIEKYLLVSGSPRRHDILDLERRCEAAGFNLGRTGQFGIGVLSYFMLADRVEIRTRRSSARNDAETHGWRFQTEGVGFFGELRKDSQGKRGTTVALRLRQDVVESREMFLSRLQGYLIDALLRVPCAFRLLGEGEAGPRLRLSAGWQPFERWMSNVIRSPSKEIEGVVRERFRSAIRWKDEVGQLPRGIGQYHLSIPFFDLPGGRSGMFFDFDRDRDIARPLPGGNILALPPGLEFELRAGLQGMRVRLAGQRHSLPYIAEIDWESSRAGQITVDRSSFLPSEEAQKAVSWLESRGLELEVQVLTEEPSDYAELNASLTGRVPASTEAWWFGNPPDQEGLRWAKLSLPALRGSSLDVLKNAVVARTGGRLISITQPFTFHTRSRGEVSVDWGSRVISSMQSMVRPDRPAIVSASPLSIVSQYSRLPRMIFQHATLFRGEFPSVWGLLAALGHAEHPWLWNRVHPLVRLIEEQDLEWFERGSQIISKDRLQTRGKSALFLMLVLESEKALEQYAIRDGYWLDVWDRVAVDPAEIMAWVQPVSGQGALRVLRPEGIEEIPATDPRIPRYLPDPGDEWKLTIRYKDDSVGDA